MAQTYIAFLRGINVGGNNLVKMADLRSFIEDLGFENPKTLLQSGNLVFSGIAQEDKALAQRLTKEAESRLSIRTEFFIRNLAELEDLLHQNPFKKEAEEDPSHLLIHFLKSQPDVELAKRVEGATKTEERIEPFAQHLFVYYPHGIGDSKLTSTLGWRELGGLGTARNWNTVRKLITIARQLAN